MCQARPGPRCANHSRKTVNSLTTRYRNTENEINWLKSSRDAQGEEFPKAAARRLRTLEERLKNYRGRLYVAIREYDGTPTGQRELSARIDNPGTTDDERRVLTERRKRGAMLRSWQEHRLAVSRGETEQRPLREILNPPTPAAA